jgi:hypothetical protein
MAADDKTLYFVLRDDPSKVLVTNQLDPQSSFKTIHLMGYEVMDIYCNPLQTNCLFALLNTNQQYSIIAQVCNTTSDTPEITTYIKFNNNTYDLFTYCSRNNSFITVNSQNGTVHQYTKEEKEINWTIQNQIQLPGRRVRISCNDDIFAVLNIYDVITLQHRNQQSFANGITDISTLPNNITNTIVLSRFDGVKTSDNNILPGMYNCEKLQACLISDKNVYRFFLYDKQKNQFYYVDMM